LTEVGHRSLRWTALAVALSLVGFGVESQEREPVRIGIVYTNTGPLARLGIDMRDGALLFWSQAGQRAGGRRVEILTESTGSNKPDEGLTKARKLVERDRATSRASGPDEAGPTTVVNSRALRDSAAVKFGDTQGTLEAWSGEITPVWRTTSMAGR